MTWHAYAISLGVGLAIGVIYGLLTVRSPAPPIIALLGLLGMLAGESLIQWVRGHQDALSHALHDKSFAILRKELSHPHANEEDANGRHDSL